MQYETIMTAQFHKVWLTITKMQLSAKDSTLYHCLTPTSTISLCETSPSSPSSPSSPLKRICLEKSYGRKGISAFAQRDGYLSPSEDRVIVEEIDSTTMLYAVLDGHQGSFAAEFISKNLPAILKSDILLFKTTFELQDYATAIAEIMKEAFLKADEKLLQCTDFSGHGGCTGTVAIVTETHVIVGNIGDSPCFSFSKKDGSVLTHSTVDHDPKNPAEVRRIYDNSGLIMTDENGNLRVGGCHLGVSRAFGHRSLKKDSLPEKQIICAIPDIQVWPRTEDMMLVLCSDSFTEKVTNEGGVKMIRNILTTEDILHQVITRLQAYSFDVSKTVEALVKEQVWKFKYKGYCAGQRKML